VGIRTINVSGIVNVEATGQAAAVGTNARKETTQEKQHAPETKVSLGFGHTNDEVEQGNGRMKETPINPGTNNVTHGHFSHDVHKVSERAGARTQLEAK
jgi:hypothetical protein